MQTIISEVVPAQLLPRKYLTLFCAVTVSVQLGQVASLLLLRKKDDEIL